MSGRCRADGPGVCRREPADGRDLSLSLVPAAGLPGLESFLADWLGGPKASFLSRHGEWWYRGAENQLALLDGERIAGYCGVIPVECLVEGQRHSAVWWIDLVIDQEYRGRGLQRIFDDHVRERTELKLGFPNELAARIHRRHGWGVRDDFDARLCVLRPGRVRSLATARGTRRLVNGAMGLLLSAYAGWLRSSVTEQGWAVDAADPGELAEIFVRHHPAGVSTVVRDEQFFVWRYLESPHPGEMRFLIEPGRRVAAVVRAVRSRWGVEMRLLDVFGAIADPGPLRPIVRQALSLALSTGAVQMTAFSSYPGLMSALRRAGFLLRRPGRFCWFSADRSLQATLGASSQHWVLGDSDHDQPPPD